MTRGWHGLFSRSETDRLAFGVAGGLAGVLGVDAVLVRLAFVTLTVASGLGIALYLVALALSSPAGGMPQGPAVRRLMPGPRAIAALGCVVFGAMLVVRDTGLWFGDAVVWPLVLACCGSALIWARSERRYPARLLAGATVARVLIGGMLVLGGMAFFLVTHASDGTAAAALLAAAVTAVGLGLILAPWILRLARDASAERRERIRSEERAEIAAHLHDSVLHTLVQIQRSDAPAEVVSVARRQERELRAWLNGRPIADEAADLREAIDSVASRVEEMHHVPVDTVVVGEAALDESSRAIVLACQEAAINAARHSGAAHVSIYVEAEPKEITAYVRDKGHGFERASVPRDRRGISESIVGRMRRVGGTATISSTRGEGTEVRLHAPRQDA